MKTKKPIKRMEALRPLSREHHQGLLLCWKIRSAFNKNIAMDRVKRYTDWFFQLYLLPHFEIEEQYLFPILGGQHPMVKKAVAQHRRLAKLFAAGDQLERNFSRLEEELAQHIRFEERILFNEIQKTASEDQLKQIEDHHQATSFIENTEDEFWK